ncbi:hypothetical protein DIE38_01175 [Campylobacter upsaliensis]|nr:hypothetical protein [Campylobacter upsaliensis]
MEFNFNFEAFEKSGKEKNEAINYLKSLNSSIDFDKLEQENKGDENAIYEALKGGNFSFSKPSIEQTRQKLLKNKENEALKAEFNAGLSWLGEEKKQDYNFYDFKKAKEKANSKQGLTQADLKEKEKQMQKKEALFETRLKERGIIAKSFDDMLDQSGAYLGADLLEKGLNKLGFKDENYIFESEKEDIKSRALKSVREKLERGDLEFNEREKHALRSKYDEPDYKKALEKEKERLRLSQKSGNFNEAEREFIENDLGFFNTLFNDDKENIKEFKEKVKSEGVISSEIIKAANTLKAFDEGNLFKNMLFADEKEKKEFQQNFLNDAYKIAELSGFDDVGLDKKGELYFIKDEQKYLVNTGFFDNFAQLLNDTKFEFAGGVLGGLKGFNSGKSAKGKVAKSILGAAAGSFGGAFLDAKIADMYLNRESDFKKNLDFAIQAGLLSMAGDGVILSVKPLAKGLYKGVKKGGEILGEYSILGTLKTLPEQNIQAAEKIIDEVFSPKMKEELKAAQEEFGGSVRGEDLKNAFFANLQKKFTQKYGENDSKTKSVAKIAEIFNTNSLKTRQQAMLDLVRSDKDGSTLAYLLEIAKDDVKIQSNLKNMLNLASSNVEKNLKNLNINAREIKHILDEFEAGNKAAFKEVESQISKLYDENYRVVLSKGEYENIKEEFRQNGVNLEEMTPFLRDLEANVFNENGVSFTQLNNFRKNLNFYIYNRDKTPNFINTLKKIGENILKNEIDKGIDNIFSQNKAAYESIKELYSTSLKDYATLKSLNESIKNLKLQDSAKSADEVLNSLIKYAKGQGEKGVNNLQKIKDYLGEENNAFLEMQILNKLFKESVVENDRASLRVFDSEGFLSRVRELVGDTPAPLGANLEARALSGASQGPSKQENFIKKALSEAEFKERNAFTENFSHLKGLLFSNESTGIKASFGRAGLKKMTSDKAILKSVNNGFSVKEHLEAVKNIKELYEKASYKGVDDDVKYSDKAVKIHRFISEFEGGNAEILVKESLDKNQNKIYTLELKELYKNSERNASLIQSFTSRASKQSNGLASEKTAKTAHANDFTKETHLSLNSNESITQPLFKSKEAREFLEELSPSAVPKQINIDEFLNTLENFKNKENFLKHIEKDPKRKDYLNLIEPTLKEPDIAFKKLENGVEKEKFIKKFSDGKDFFYLLATKDNKETILTAFKTDKINTILKEFNADIIPTFIRQGSKGKAAGTTNEGIITQPLFKSKEAREFLELVEGFHKLYKNDASIAKNLVQGTSEKLSTSIATSAEGAIKQKVVKGAFDPIFRLLPDKILFGLFAKQIQGGALRYHLKKALGRSLNYDDFKIKLEKELKRTNFNSNTSRLIDEFMQNLDTFNAEKEAKLAKIREEQARIKEEEQARINAIKTAQENAYNAQEANLGNDILESSSLKEDFGENFAGYKGKEAIEKLLEEQRGQVKGAFYKEGLGEIDLVWGEITDLEKHKGYGLAHILDKRKSEFVEQGASQSEAAQKAAEFAKNEISNIMQNGKIINKANEATRIETQDYRLILKQNWKGEPTKNKWLVTAYMKKEKGESISSTPFTKEDNLSLNSKESIAQKALNLHEKLYLKDNDTPLNVEYKIVNKDDIKPSFTLSKTQFRSQKQEDLIKKIKENFNPDLLVNIRGDLKKGNPIITKEGEVISGNHRAAALKELEGENLSKYQNAVKEAFGVELKENEMLVRVADTSEAEIRRFSAASNEGLENNLGEQGVSLFAKYQDKIKALKEAKKPFVADDVYNLKYLVNKALGESSITKENDTSKALFASLARGRNNTILKALNELEKENLEQVSKVANMFFDNAGAFYNLTHDLDLPKMQNLQNYFSDVLVSAAKADFTRAEDFARLNEDIRAFLDSGDKNAMLKLSPNLVSDLLAKAMGAGFARFARLENPSASLYEFLNGLKKDLLEKGAPDLFSGGKGIKLNERDEFDFAKELILKGQDSEEKFRLYQNLEELKAWKSKSSLNQPTKELKHKMLERLKPLFNQEITTKDGFKGVFNLKSLSKMTSDKAIQKSVNNGFSKEEHLRAVLDIERLFKNANLAKTYNDEKGGSESVIIHRFNSEFENANALITTKESLDKDLNKIYTLELELTPRFSDEVRPTDTKSNTGGFNSQEHMADESIATIAKTDEESIAQNSEKLPFETQTLDEDKLSGDEVRLLANKIGEKSSIAYFKDYLLKMDKNFHARAKDIIREYYKIEPFRKELENQWENVKEAYKNGEMSLKEFKFLSRYKDEKSFLNQVAGVLWLQNDELVKKRGYIYNEYGEIEEGRGANYYNNLALEYGKAQTALKKWFYYIQKANKQAQRFFNKKELEDLRANEKAQKLEAKGSEDIIFTDKKGKEHTLTKETQKAWLEAFNLKSLDEAYIPNFKAEVKEAINRVLGGEEIKLTKGSLIKLIKEKRLKYLDRIKPTLENPHSVILQNDGALIFARDYGEEKYFTSVARNDSGEWIIRSNAPKSKNGLNNKILNGGKEIYNDQAASQINASNPYDDIANSNIKLDNESIAQNADYLELVKEYGEENAKRIIKQKILGENIAQVLENEEEKFIYKKGDREFEFKIKDAMGQFEMQYDELNLKSDLNKSFLKALNKLKIGYEVLENEPVRIRYFKQEAKERKPKETKPSANKTLGQIQKDMSARLKELKAQAKENYERYKNEDKALQKELTNTKDLFKAFEKEFNETEGTILISRAKRRKNDAEGKVETSVFLGNELALRNALDRWERYSGYSEENALEVKERLELLRSYVKRLEKHREDIRAKREQLEQDYQQNEAARSKEMGVIGNYNILSNLKGVSENELYEPFLEKVGGYLSKADFYERHLPFAREEFQKLFNITPLKEFGTNYAEFYRDGKGAVEKLLAEKQGQVAGAFYKEGLGEIDLVWGEAGSGKSDGFGLAKIVKYHPEVIDKLDDIIANTSIVKESDNRYHLENENYKLAIRKDFEGKKTNWLLTAFEKKDSIARRRTDLPSSQSEAEKTTSANANEIIPQEIEQAEIKKLLEDYGEQISSNYPQETARLILEQNKNDGIVLSGFKIKGKSYDPEIEAMQFKTKKAEREFESLMKSYDIKGDFLNFKEAYSFKPNDEAFLQYLAKYEGDENAKLALAYNLAKQLVMRRGGGRAEVYTTDFLRQMHILENQNSTTLHSNPHLGAGLVGGTLNGVEQDENGNLSFDPVKFAMGFLGGAAGSKAVKESIKWRANKVKKAYPNIAKNNPTLMQEIAKRDLLTYAKNETQNALTRLLNKNKLFDINKQIFAGEKALLSEAYAPHKARLEKAKELEISGADEIEIWEKTGWYKDKDHKWKFEISQRGGELKLKFTPENKGADWLVYSIGAEKNLVDFLKDDELFKAYPQLQDIKIKTFTLQESADSPSVVGRYDPYNKVIKLNAENIDTDIKQAKSTLYHEIQHAIQDIEGFAYGERLEQISKDNYRLRHGEVEARNVQKRLDLDARAYAKIKDGKFYSGEKEIQAELANDKEYQKALREFQKSLDKDTKKSGREWERHENLRSFLTQRERQVEAKFEKSEPMTIEQGHLPHPYETMDTPLKDTIAQASMHGEALSKELESKEANTHTLREQTKELLKPFTHKLIKNKNDNTKAIVTMSGIKEMLSAKAINQSVKNGFKAKQHIKAVMALPTLFENAVFKDKQAQRHFKDYVEAYRVYSADFEGGKAIISVQERKIGNDVLYFLKLDELRLNNA